MGAAEVDCMASPESHDAIIERYKLDVDVTLIRENLKLTPHERMLKLIVLQRFAEELRRAGQEARKPDPS
jgi:hypothetical protein